MKHIYFSLLCLFAINSNLNAKNAYLIPPTADFSSNKEITCVDEIVTFMDTSLESPTSWTWSFSPNTVTYENGTNTNSENPEVSFNAIGEYSVALMVTNVDGSDSVARPQYVVSSSTVPFSEDFSGGVPPTGWAVINPDNSEGWESTTTAGSDGNVTQVIRMDNYQYNAPGELDEFVLPSIGVSGITNPILYFDVAYAAFGPSNFERLHIEYSTDCGATFTASSYDKQDLDLATVAYQVSGWAPQQASDWRAETVDLTGYSGGEIILKFIQTAGYGNGLFIDNIRVEENGTLSNVEEEVSNFMVFPNPSKGIFQIKSQYLSSELNIIIYDIKGRKVYSKQVLNFNEMFLVDLKNLSRGNYIMKLVSEQKTYLKKILLN